MFKASIVPLIVNEHGEEVWLDESAELVSCCAEFQHEHQSAEEAMDVLADALSSLFYEEISSEEATLSQDALAGIIEDAGGSTVSVRFYRRSAPRHVTVGNRTVCFEGMGQSETKDGRQAHVVAFECYQPLRGWSVLSWLEEEGGCSSLSEDDLDTAGWFQVTFWFEKDSKIGFVKMALRWPELFDQSTISRLG